MTLELKLLMILNNLVENYIRIRKLNNLVKLVYNNLCVFYQIVV